MRRSVGALAGCLLAATSCGVLSGLDDLQVVGIAPGPDGSTSDAPGSADGVAGCTPTSTVEVCEDGVDNDCNGLIDCGDPACTPSFECAPLPPDGWTFAAAAFAATPACPPLVPTAQDVVSAPADSAASCACTCDTSDTSCTKGLYAFTFGDGCASAPGTLDPSAACGALTAALAKDTPLHLAPPAPPATCSPNLKKTIPAPQRGRLCQGAPVGKGCANGTMCVPRVQAPLQSCVTRTGDQTCPTTYGVKLFAGSGVQSDTRDCTTCTCESGTCSGTATLYEGPNCNGRSLVLKSSDACSTPGNDQLGVSSYALGLLGGGCNVGQRAALTGTLTLADQRTICCRP